MSFATRNSIARDNLGSLPCITACEYPPIFPEALCRVRYGIAMPDGDTSVRLQVSFPEYAHRQRNGYFTELKTKYYMFSKAPRTRGPVKKVARLVD